MTRYSVIFRDSLYELQEVDDVWAANETWDALQAALMARFHHTTPIVDIRKIGELVDVK